jgi:hypothetical protein
MDGKILIVGFGPGSFEYITLRAREVIQESQVIVGNNTYVDLIRNLWGLCNSLHQGCIACPYHQRPVEETTIWIPAGKWVTFQLQDVHYTPGEAQAATIKDGGDDPDATHGAKIIATVSWTDHSGVEIRHWRGPCDETRSAHSRWHGRHQSSPAADDSVNRGIGTCGA